MDIQVWVMPKVKTVLITDDPGVPIAACVIEGEDMSLVGSCKQFDYADVEKADEYAYEKAVELKFELVESWRFAPWADVAPDDDDWRD